MAMERPDIEHDEGWIQVENWLSLGWGKGTWQHEDTIHAYHIRVQFQGIHKDVKP